MLAINMTYEKPKVEIIGKIEDTPAIKELISLLEKDEIIKYYEINDELYRLYKMLFSKIEKY